jgi:hypothetical protein
LQFWTGDGNVSNSAGYLQQMSYGAVLQTNGQTILTSIPSPSQVCLVDIALAVTAHLQDLSGNSLSVTLKQTNTK